MPGIGGDGDGVVGVEAAGWLCWSTRQVLPKDQAVADAAGLGVRLGRNPLGHGIRKHLRLISLVMDTIS